ncbi:MAG: type II secretion system F family protein [Armatimonadota bacterium]|nr:type II secretion system F family protein [Armatimonadota bacterium]MDW8155798.1 type II secretion system F family protein [Armatimonadota bacterium]
MPTFEYVARDASGRAVRGRAQAQDRRELAALLRRQGLFLTSVDAHEDSPSSAVRVSLRARELAEFAHHMATLLGAGLTVFAALQAVEEHSDTEDLRRLARALREEVERGSALSAALDRVCRGLPPVFVGVVQSGEATGRLDAAFQRLSAHLERELEFRRKVRDALAYPAVVLAAAAVVVGVFLVYVVPAFERVYRSAGASLPPLTQALLATSAAVRSALPGLAGVGVFFAWPALRQAGWALLGPAVTRWVEGLPAVGALVRTARAGRFLHALGAGLTGGVPLLTAVDVAARAAGWPAWSAVCRARLEGGGRLSDSLRLLPGFPPLASRFVGLGEESGRVADMVLEAARLLDREFEQRVRRLLAGLEPALTIALAVVVGGILAALYMPIFGLGRAVLRGQ